MKYFVHVLHVIRNINSPRDKVSFTTLLIIIFIFGMQSTAR